MKLGQRKHKDVVLMEIGDDADENSRMLLNNLTLRPFRQAITCDAFADLLFGPPPSSACK
jgi:hypothetical protein